MPGFPTLPSPRFLTALDPYYYEVDNRPLLDLAARDDAIRDNINAINSAQQIITAAAGFIARGYTSQNNSIGRLSYPGGLVLSVDRAFLTQETQISGTDTRTFPKIALSENPKTFTFTAPATNFYRTYSIQAKVDTPDSTLPFFDSTAGNIQSTTQVGSITWLLKQSGVDQSDLSTLSYPSVDAGYIEIMKVTIPGGVSSITQAQLTFSNFSLEGALADASNQASTLPTYQYLHDQQTVSSATDTLYGITVNCLYAFIFVDGAITHGVSRNSTSSVTFDEVLPVGTVVDFITTVGGQAVAASGTQTVQTLTAGAGGQSVFNGVTITQAAAIVYVQGLYQNPSTYTLDSANSRLTFNTPVPAGYQINVILLTGLPSATSTIPGGFTNQVLAKNSNTANDFSWKDPTFTFPGGTAGQVLTKNSTTVNDFSWGDTQKVHGQCQLTVNGNNLVLKPYNGNQLSIGTTSFPVPSAGVSINPAALPVGIYGVYAYYDTQMRLELVNNATTPFTQTTSGIFVKTGDSTRTLVGFLNLETAGVVEATDAKMFVRSWFNEPPIMLSVPNQTSVAMNAFSPSQYTYINGQVLKMLNIPGDVVTYQCNCTAETTQGETASVALADNAELGTIAFASADVELSFGSLSTPTQRSSATITNSYKYTTVSANYVALYGNESSASNPVYLSARFKGVVTRI